MVNVVLPSQRCGLLTTVGEVHFLATPLSAFPQLNRVSKQFRGWLRQHPCIHSHRQGFTGEWNYFLEGSVRNLDSEIFALPSGLAALQRGDYFVSADDSERTLDLVCRRLRLRDVPLVGNAEAEVPTAPSDM